MAKIATHSTIRFLNDKAQLRVFMATLAFLIVHLKSSGQAPVCGMVYYLTQNQIYNYDPAQPVTTNIPSSVLPNNPSLNSIQMPVGAVGLAVSDNLNGSGPSPTFYTTMSGYYLYWDGSNWVNTGNLIGPVGANGYPNIGAGGGFIYSFDWGSTSSSFPPVYKYDGTGDATPVINSVFIGGALLADITADCNGNFYILKLPLDGTLPAPAPAAYLRRFNSSGTLLQTWGLDGTAVMCGGAGMAMVKDTLYFGGSYAVVDPGSPSITFVPFGTTLGCSDMAACPGGGSQGALVSSADTAFYCDDQGVQLTASGFPGVMAANWEILSGDASIQHVASGIIAKANGVAQIELRSTCYSPDTVVVVGPAKIDAGADLMIPGCNGNYIDTLSGLLSNSATFVQYQYSWSPSSYIQAGINDLSPIVAPPVDTIYYLTVSTPQVQGGCVWTDSIEVHVADSSVKADFIYSILFGCSGEDTVSFENISAGSVAYEWNFGDGSISSQENPSEIYSYGNYTVMLIASNPVCRDTVSKEIQARALKLILDLGNDVPVCTDEKISVILQAQVPGADSFLWNDGSHLSYLPVADTGTYSVTASNIACKVSDSIKVFSEQCDCKVMIPDAFTPNADGHNDVFRPVVESGCRVLGCFMNIYNRWGQLVFSSNNFGSGWDGSVFGQPADLGIYMYDLKIQVGEKAKQHQYKGDVTLIR